MSCATAHLLRFEERAAQDGIRIVLCWTNRRLRLTRYRIAPTSKGRHLYDRKLALRVGLVIARDRLKVERDPG